MKQITNISTSVLKIHPRNKEFFDDIDGESYKQFKKSIKEDGVLTPLLVSPDMTVISGHQRLKACEDLGIGKVPVIIREDLEDEDDKLRKLLASNFGRMKNDPKKQRKVAVQYVELVGLRDGEKLSDNHKALTQSEIAKQLGVSVPTLNEMLAIERKLTPEIKELLDNGIITKTSASKIWTKLSEEEQVELLEELGRSKLQEMTQRQTENYIRERESLKKENDTLRQQLTEQKSRKDKVAIPDHIEYKIQELESKHKEEQITNQKLQDMVNKLNKEKRALEDTINSDDYQLDKLKKEEEILKYKAHVSMFETQIIMQKFIDDFAPVMHKQISMAVVDRNVRKEMIETTKSLEGIVDFMKNELKLNNQNNYNPNNNIIINMEEN